MLTCTATATVFAAGLELPLPNSFNGSFVQAHPQRALHSNITRAALGAYNYPEHNRTLILGFACFLRKFRIGSIDDARRCRTSSNAVNSTPDATAPTWTDPRTTPRTHSVATTGAFVALDQYALQGTMSW
jgi:hypothetical protein